MTHDDRDTQVAPVTLSDLIRSHQDRTGESYATIARRAELSKAKIGQLANTTQNHMPRVDTLERLAKGIGVPLRVIQQAAMASAGITPEDYSGEQRLDLVVAALRDLSNDDLETVFAVIQSLTSRHRLPKAG
jgi:transcriptional regulator with XRE-family HTH domain